MLSEEEALDAWSDANGYRPVPASWGFFTRGDRGGPWNFGGNGFTWFSTQKKMVPFFWEIVPPAMVEVEPEAIQTIMDSIKNHVDEFNEAKLTLEQFREKLNDNLSGWVQIDWIGTLTDLMTGDHPYAKEVREGFHQRQADDDTVQNSSAIKPEEKKAFLEFAGQWGL